MATPETTTATKTLYILTGVVTSTRWQMNGSGQAVVVATGTEEAMNAKAKTAECKMDFTGMMVTPLEVEIS